MRRGKGLHGQRGMTLIEIMVVVAIMGLIMGTVAVSVTKSLADAKIKTTKQVIMNVQQAIVQYQTEATDACPKTLDELYDKRILTKKPVDAWGEPLVFKCPGDKNPDGADIISKGKDKQEGTPDDVKSWEL